MDFLNIIQKVSTREKKKSLELLLWSGDALMLLHVSTTVKDFYFALYNKPVSSLFCSR